jgi:hypothetical protein
LFGDDSVVPGEEAHSLLGESRPSANTVPLPPDEEEVSVSEYPFVNQALSHLLSLLRHGGDDVAIQTANRHSEGGEGESVSYDIFSKDEAGKHGGEGQFFSPPLAPSGYGAARQQTHLFATPSKDRKSKSDAKPKTSNRFAPIISIYRYRW